MSLIPVDFRVVVELHLPRCGLGPCEAGLLAGLLAHDWGPSASGGAGATLQLLCLAGNPFGPAGCAAVARAVAGKPLRYPLSGGGGYSGGGVLHPRGGAAALPNSVRAGSPSAA